MIIRRRKKNSSTSHHGPSIIQIGLFKIKVITVIKVPLKIDQEDPLEGSAIFKAFNQNILL